MLESPSNPLKTRIEA